MEPIRVRVPATTANLGPGYDCLGMALDLWNVVEIRSVTGRDGRVVVEGEGAGTLAEDETNLVYQAMTALAGRAGQEVPALEVRCYNQIPLRRGLGSSSAAIVGGLVAANHLLGRPLADDDLLHLAVELEGHPDNVAPALLGGLRVVAAEDGRLITAPIPVPPELTAVLFVPEVTIATQEARAVLPGKVSRDDAVYNIARVAMLVNALTFPRLQDLRCATGDRLHQPYRQKLFPAMKLIFAAAMEGGALGVFLSGSGSTILALTLGQEMTVAYEMAEAGRRSGIAGAVKVTRPTAQGAYLV